jgi:hypothetical protein
MALSMSVAAGGRVRRRSRFGGQQTMHTCQRKAVFLPIARFVNAVPNHIFDEILQRPSGVPAGMGRVSAHLRVLSVDCMCTLDRRVRHRDVFVRAQIDADMDA